MSVRSDRPLEYAMTHRAGADGLKVRTMRPESIRAIADRLRGWAGNPETCKACQSQRAIALRFDMALCGRCRAQVTEQIAPGLDPVGRAARAEPEDDIADRWQLRGIAIVFNRPSVDMGFREFIRPSAVDRNEAESIDVRALWSHNPDWTIGRNSAGTLRQRKVSRGLSVEIDPPRWAAGYVETVQRRDVTGMSFAFETLTDDWRLEDGEPVREILDMRYYEVSGVAFPAYEDTTLRVAKGSERSSWDVERQTRERLMLIQ